MRRSIGIVLTCCLLAGSLGCSHSSGRLVGAWKMVFPTQTTAETTGDGTPSEEASTKILTDTHFAFGGTGSDGRMYAGGGRYTLERDTYTETIEYHFNPRLVGKTIAFTCRLDGDRWYHSGIFEIDGERFHIEEIWQRIQ